MNDPQFGLQLRMITALVFVPPQDVVNSFDKLFVVIQNQCEGDAEEVLYYFKDTYIGRFQRIDPRHTPLFPVELQNMLNRPDEQLPRTNNNIEVWHNSFQANVSSTHPKFWKFLDVLLREEHIVRVRMLQNQARHAPEPRRHRYADCNAFLLRIADDFPDRQVMDYLQHIAHNLSL